MKTAGIWREVWRDLASGTARGSLFAFLLVLIMGALAAIDLAQVRSFTEQAEAYRDAGASISVLEAPNQIDGAACQALANIPGVNASGAIRLEEDRLTLSALPGAPVPLATVTPNFEKLLGVQTLSGGILLSDQVAESVQAISGQAINTTKGDTLVAGIYPYPADGRKPGFGYMAMLPSNENEPFDQCWAEVWPQSDQTRSLIYTALLPTKDSSNITLGQLNSSLGTAFSGISAYQNRITQYGFAVAGIAGIALGFVSVRIRRLEVASHLHAGIARKDQRRILFLETAAWVIVAAIVVESIAAIIIASDPSSDRPALFVLANRIIFAGGLSAILGALISLQQTKEHHLFSYFKNR